MKYLDEEPNFKNCIKNICVYCLDIEKWCGLISKYNLIKNVVNSQKDVIDFIKNFSSGEIKPYHMTKIVTFNHYLEKYKDRHKKISQYYGDLTPQSFKDNFEKMKLLIDKYTKKKNYITKIKMQYYKDF